MVRNCGILFVHGALIAGALATGCSTYEVRDTYLPLDESRLEYQNDTLNVRIAFDPDTRFYSFGIAGIPVIPTVVDSDGSSMVTLVVEFHITDHLEFSFAHDPCASFDGGDPVCPFETEVVARAMAVDDGSTYEDQRPRWHRIEEFSGSRVLHGSARITPATIYQHLGASGKPSWDSLRLTLSYKYRCEAKCPQRIDLDVTDLVSVEGLQMPAGLRSFEKSTDADYTGLAGE
jgi:hypothetical protein